LVLPEDGDRIQFPKRCVLKEKQDDISNKDKTMDNVKNIIFVGKFMEMGQISKQVHKTSQCGDLFYLKN
jgi:hypothetical protein